MKQSNLRPPPTMDANASGDGKAPARRVVQCAALLAGVLIAQVAGSAQVYRWTDNQGNVHFSDKRPDGGEAAGNVEGVFYDGEGNVMQSQPGSSSGDGGTDGGGGDGGTIGGGGDSAGGSAGTGGGSGGGGGGGGGGGDAGGGGDGGALGQADGSGDPGAPADPGGQEQQPGGGEQQPAVADEGTEGGSDNAPSGSLDDSGSDGLAGSSGGGSSGGGDTGGSSAVGGSSSSAGSGVADEGDDSGRSGGGGSSADGVSQAPSNDNANGPKAVADPKPVVEPVVEAPKPTPNPKPKPKPRVVTDCPPQPPAHLGLLDETLYARWEGTEAWYIGDRMDDAVSLTTATAASRFIFDGMPYHEIDPVERATILHFYEGQQALPLAANLRFRFPEISPDNTLLATFVWEAKYDPRFFTGYKSFQITNDKQIHIELNPFSNEKLIHPDETTWLMVPGTRTYKASLVGGSGNGELLSTGSLTDPNMQPALDAPARNYPYCYARDHVTGTHPRAFLVRPGQWYRYIYTVDWSSTPHRLWLWMESEDTPRTLLLSEEGDPTRGFPLEWEPERSGLHEFWFEFGNSRSLNEVDFDVKVRNFFIVRNVLGGDL